MQNTTGTLSPGAHPGSYNGQDAYNDMFVVDDGSSKYRERTDASNINVARGESLGYDARQTENIEGGV